MTAKRQVSRRTALKLGAAVTALPLVHIRTAGAAGKLSLALWDHWVPTGDAAMKKLIDDWAEKNKVAVNVDFIPSVGSKINITMAAEAQAKTGHDVYAFDQWTVHQYSDSLDPVDDVMQRLIAKYGKLGRAYEYLALIDKHWMAVPVGWGSAPLPPVARLSMWQKFAGIDVKKWFPDSPATPEASKEWTYDKQLEVAEAFHKAGYPIGLGCREGDSTDAKQVWGATFGAFGADLVNAKGEVTVESDHVMAVMEYVQKLIKFMPSDAPQWDDASNNRALISGRTPYIWNPPSAWAVAKRDAPEVAADCWHFSTPRGPAGRLVPHRPYFWGIWKFAQNKSAAKELIEHLSQREQVEYCAVPVAGYDIPPFTSMYDMKIWSEVEPPKGTIFNYPVRQWHDAEYYIAGSSAPPEIAVQMWNRGIMPAMVARLMAGQSIKQTIAWAKDELQGFIR
jgi:ABC-type glycerol-3-phosphate transport system substrate-binding protein